MKASTIWDKRWVRFIAVAAFWLGLWQAVALALPKLLFAGPAQTVQSLLSKRFSAVFCIAHTVKCVNKLNNIMNTNPFICCFTP